LGRTTPPQLARTTTRRIIVRRGEVATFALLERTFADDPAVEVIWDRRASERAHTGDTVDAERAYSDRRREPPAQWQQLHYLVVPPTRRRLNR
jgi:hypothetical protein